MTDSANQTWSQTKSGYLSVNTVARAGCFWVASSAAVSTVTAKYATQGGVDVRTITVVEIADAAPASLEDVSIGQGAISDGVGSSLQSGALTTTNANDLLLFYVGVGDDVTAWTAGAGYTIPSNLNAAGGSGSNPRTAVETTTLATVQTNTTAILSWSPVLASGHSLLGIFVAVRGKP